MLDINLDKTSVTAAVKGAMTAKDVVRLREIETEVAGMVTGQQKLLDFYIRVFSECIAAQATSRGPGSVAVNLIVGRSREMAASAVQEFAQYALRDVAGAQERALVRLAREKWLEEANKAK